MSEIITPSEQFGLPEFPVDLIDRTRITVSGDTILFYFQTGNEHYFVNRYQPNADITQLDFKRQNLFAPFLFNAASGAGISQHLGDKNSPTMHMMKVNFQEQTTAQLFLLPRLSSIPACTDLKTWLSFFLCESFQLPESSSNHDLLEGNIEYQNIVSLQDLFISEGFIKDPQLIVSDFLSKYLAAQQYHQSKVTIIDNTQITPFSIT